MSLKLEEVSKSYGRRLALEKVTWCVWSGITAVLLGPSSFGQPVLTGARLGDLGLILLGAIPVAILALAVQGLFELSESAVVPRGLRASGESA